jgi:hypothetical protein
MVRCNVPNGEHVTIEHRLRTVFGVQLEALSRGLREDVYVFTRAICDAATRETA